MNSRIENIYIKLDELSLDAFLTSSPANISYLTECTSREAYLLVSKKENIYLTDSRYFEEDRSKLKASASIKKIDGCVFKIIADTSFRLGLKQIGFEERYCSLRDYQILKARLNKRISLVPTRNIVEELRQIKDAQEIECIKKAIQITVSAFRFIEGFIAFGKREIEVSAELERFIRYNGASSAAFDIIVASGPNSSFPHHASSQRRIKRNEPVLIDIGVNYQGYKSDLTRVLFLGKIPLNFRRIYDIVLTAQERAIKEIRPAVSIYKIDRAARQYITQRGYGGFFGHSLGHGVGLEVHEAPYVSGKERKQKLMRGMVFTIEPAIYLPNKFGIRIEDMVRVTQNGPEILSADLDREKGAYRL